MNPSERVKMIQARLEQAFSPIKLEVIDDSERHKGHAGSQGGAGHYTVRIAAECFNNQSRVSAHRMIYTELNDLMPQEIHALKIIIDENNS